MFKIGDFSKLTMISIRMLRHYDTNGLLVPKQTDPFTGYRYYDASQLRDANRIQRLRSMGLGVADIKKVMDASDNAEQMEDFLLSHLSRLKQEDDKLKKQIALAAEAISRIGKDEYTMDYHVTLKEFPETTVAALRDVIPRYEEEGRMWTELYGELAAQKITPAQDAVCSAVFFDEGYKEADVDVEIRVSVKSPGRATERVRFPVIAPLSCATVVVNGDYSHMDEACAAVGDWINRNGYRMNGPMFNIYVVSPGMDPNPENWVTEVCFPVTK